MSWVVFVTAFLAIPGLAHTSCRTLLETFLGPGGVSSFSLSSERVLTQWRDQFQTTSQGTSIPDFSVDSSLLPRTIEPPISFSSLLPGQFGERFGVISDETGGLFLLTPQLKTVPFYFQSTAPAVHVLKPSIYRHFAQLGFDALQGTATDRLISLTQLRELLWTSVQHDSSYLFVGDGRDLYRSKLQFVSGDQLPTRIREMVTEGPVRLERSAPFLGEDPRTRHTQAVPVPVIDAEYPNAKYLIASGRADVALQIEPFEKIWEASDSKLLDRIDFVRPLGQNSVVLASELGQVLVLNPDHSILAALTLDRVGWISDVSAHRIGDNIEVWVIAKPDHKIYRWHSKAVTQQLTLMEDQLPEGIEAQAISTMAHRLPPGFYSTERQLGYYSDFTQSPPTIYLERILVLGSDGQLYGYANRGNLLETQKRWITDTFSSRRHLCE